MAHPRNIVLSGPPRVGKTTVVQKILSRLKARCGGFFTQAVDTKAFYTDFRLVTVNGRNRELADADLVHRFDIPGLLGFNLADLEARGGSSVLRALDTCQVVVVDQLGTLEMSSAPFRTIVQQVLDSDRLCLATMGLSDHPFLEEVRRREDVEIHAVTLSNRSTLPDEISVRIQAVLEGLSPRQRSGGAADER